MARGVAAMLFVLTLVAAPAAFAQLPDDYDADSLSETGFQTTESEGDEVPGGRFMLIAYCAFFGLIAGYVVHLSQRQARVQREFGDLRRSMEDLDDQLAERGIDA